MIVFKIGNVKVCQYDQEIPQSHTAANPRHREEEQRNIQEGLLSVISESMGRNFWLTACSSLPRKKSVVR